MPSIRKNIRNSCSRNYRQGFRRRHQSCWTWKRLEEVPFDVRSRKRPCQSNRALRYSPVGNGKRSCSGSRYEITLRGYDTAKYENKGIFVVKRSVSHDMDQVFPGYQYSPGNWDRQIHCWRSSFRRWPIRLAAASLAWSLEVAKSRRAALVTSACVVRQKTNQGKWEW